MAHPTYKLSVTVADIPLADGQIEYFRYQCMWDKGNFAHILIYDPQLEFHEQLSQAEIETPTPVVTFRLEEFIGQRQNAGTTRILLMKEAALQKIGGQMYIKIVAMDRANVLLRRTVSFSQQGTKSSEFIQNLTQQAAVTSEITETNDQQTSHRAMEAGIIEHIRYELDRCLALDTGGPISLQYDDRQGSDKLLGIGQVYGSGQQGLELLPNTLTRDGIYNLGPTARDVQGTAPSFRSVIYEFMSEQTFDSAIWGHSVNLNMLGASFQHTVGSVIATLSESLGIGGTLFSESRRRIQFPREDVDSPNSDEERAKSVLINHLFQAEMSTNGGFMIIDPDFRAYDDPTVLNKRYVKVSVAPGSGAPQGRALIPPVAVVMGWEHIIDSFSVARTKVYFRRGVE